MSHFFRPYEFIPVRPGLGCRISERIDFILQKSNFGPQLLCSLCVLQQHALPKYHTQIATGMRKRSGARWGERNPSVHTSSLRMVELRDSCSPQESDIVDFLNSDTWRVGGSLVYSVAC